MRRRFALVVLLGASSACLAAFAPNIRPRKHHASVGHQASDDTCMACHESEASMYRRMQSMARDQHQAHMRAEHTPSMAPLVQDWMLDDPGGCLGCHRLRESR